MTSIYSAHAAMLQVIAESMRSPTGGRLDPAQLECLAGLLDHIAAELLMPVPGGEMLGHRQRRIGITPAALA